MGEGQTRQDRQSWEVLLGKGKGEKGRERKEGRKRQRDRERKERKRQEKSYLPLQRNSLERRRVGGVCLLKGLLHQHAD